METKRCSGCRKIKSISEFSKDKKVKNKLYSQCKDCVREYYQKNREQILKQKKEYHQKNKEKISKRSNEWRKNNPEKVKKWKMDNSEKLKESYRKSQSKRNSILKNRLSNRISCLMRHSLKGNKNGNHWEDLICYNLKDLIIHLEKQFKDGMNWNNYGKKGWEIDHIKPISSFNFNSYKDKQFKECWTLENLQPLWASENKSKSAKYINK